MSRVSQVCQSKSTSPTTGRRRKSRTPTGAASNSGIIARSRSSSARPSQRFRTSPGRTDARSLAISMVAIARLGYRLNAVTLGAQFPAKRADHCVDDIAADECTSPDAFYEFLAANDRRCAIDELGQNLRFQRREFNDLSVDHD